MHTCIIMYSLYTRLYTRLFTEQCMCIHASAVQTYTTSGHHGTNDVAEVYIWKDLWKVNCIVTIKDLQPTIPVLKAGHLSHFVLVCALQV